jgi:membrane protease YdiL (CAAX protease family)
MRRSVPAWEARPRPQPALPVDVLAAVAGVALAWMIIWGIRRGPLVVLLIAASIGMLVVSLTRTPRHQDLLVVHQGIIVLGVTSGTALWLLFVALAPLTRRVGPLETGALKIFARFDVHGVAAMTILFVVAVASELFWRGFVQGRLADEFGDRRAYRLTLVAVLVAHLPTYNLAVMAAAVVTGVVWGWIRLRSGSIVPSTLSHIIWLWLMYLAYPI